MAIKNSKHLVKLLEEIQLVDDNMLVSYDVTALSISAPCDEVVGIITVEREPGHGKAGSS